MVVIGIPAPFQIDTIPEKAAHWHPDAALAMVHPYWNRELCKALALDSPGHQHPLPTLGMTALYHLARMKLAAKYYVCGFDWHFDPQRDTIQGHAIDTDRLPANFNHWYIKEAVWVARNLYGTPAWEFSGRAARTLDRLRDRTFAWETQHTIENRNLSDSAPGRPGKTMQSEIPKIAHFIWLGEPVPAWVSENIERFARLHPGWEIRLCRDVPPSMPADLRQRVAGSRLACMQADLIRYWLVYESGGVYLDADTYAWRCMERLLGSRTILGRMLDGRITNSVIASPPRSAGMEAILSAVRSLTHDAGKRTLYGPGMLDGVIKSAPERFQVCPAHYFNCIGTQQTAHRFWNATHAEQTEMLSHWKGRMVDGVEPYSFHLWGVEGSSYAKVPTHQRQNAGRAESMNTSFNTIQNDRPAVDSSEKHFQANGGLKVASKLSASTVAPPTTRCLLAENHRQLIMDSIPPDGQLLEWGSGGSTLWFLERLAPGQRLITIEHNRTWSQRVLDAVDGRFGDRWSQLVCPVDAARVGKKRNPLGAMSRRATIVHSTQGCRSRVDRCLSDRRHCAGRLPGNTGGPPAKKETSGNFPPRHEARLVRLGHELVRSAVGALRPGWVSGRISAADLVAAGANGSSH